MELAIITSKQVIELFLIIFAGMVLQKKKLILSDHKKMLSGLLVNFIVPCMIINSYLGDYESDVLGNLGSAFLYSIILSLGGIGIGFLTSFGVEKDKVGIYRFACGFSNAAYMGFPLVRALFGEEGILYASAYVTIFNILVWSLGCMLLSDKMNVRTMVVKVVTCPSIIAVVVGLVVYLLHIPVTEIVATPVGMVADMTTPLSMLIIGVTIGETQVLGILKEKDLWRALCVRHLLIPMLSLLLFWTLQFRGMAAMVTLVLEAAPTATLTTILAIEYDRDYEFAAGVVVVSTFLSIVLLPVYVYLLGTFGI